MHVRLVAFVTCEGSSHAAYRFCDNATRIKFLAPSGSHETRRSTRTPFLFGLLPFFRCVLAVRKPVPVVVYTARTLQ